jgi:uncharacterized protein Yka (UPF0111/DUF47 family)
MRAKKLINLLKRLVKQEHLYSADQLREMKNQIRELEEQILQIENKTSKGFGKK